MIPLLEEWGVPVHDATMLDVGCGEGGGVCAMHDRGMRCVGFDLEEHRIAMARLLQGERRIKWEIGDLYGTQLPFAGMQFDLVVLHDVFEHLDRKKEILEKLKGYMKSGGRLMITFPPYYSAYGAHQQLLNTPWMKFPFLHLVPFVLSRVLPRLKRESPRIVEEVRKLSILKMGMNKFEEITARSGLAVDHKQAYLIGPNHIRFGLKPIPAGPVTNIPLLREVACTGVVYLLSQSLNTGIAHR
jgi:2-polyprenyl-3-methyl-5-hydroxy-6-metoxy-1,4-benzoquinol methylase